MNDEAELEWWRQFATKLGPDPQTRHWAHVGRPILGERLRIVADHEPDLTIFDDPAPGEIQGGVTRFWYGPDGTLESHTGPIPDEGFEMFRGSFPGSHIGAFGETFTADRDGEYHMHFTLDEPPQFGQAYAVGQEAWDDFVAMGDFDRVNHNFVDEMFRSRMRPSFRIADALFDLAKRLEPIDEEDEDPWWPRSWVALIPSTLGCWFMDFWHWRHVRRGTR